MPLWGFAIFDTERLTVGVSTDPPLTMRSTFEFCLPTKSDTVPTGPDWLHEIKGDLSNESKLVVRHRPQFDSGMFGLGWCSEGRTLVVRKSFRRQVIYTGMDGFWGWNDRATGQGILAGREK
jgi:hypothetical protein